MGIRLESPSMLSDDPYQRLKNEYDRLRLLYDITKQLTTTFNLPHVLQQVLLTTCTSTGATRGSIILFNEYGEVQQHLLTQTFHESPPSPFTNLVVRQGLASWVLEHNQSALISDTELDERWIDYPSTVLDVRSVISVPLIRSRRVRGVLTLVHPEVAFFNQEDEDLLNVIAQHAALAIENARLMSDINDERRKFEGALTAMEEGLILVDRQGRLQFVNPQVLAFFAVRTPMPTTLGELSPELGAAFQEVLSSGDNIHTELSLLGPPRLDLAVHIAYMQILSEQEDWWTIVLHDITLLKDYDRLKTQFVANASHELRTPLANIKLYARLAEQDRANKAPQYWNTIISEASRLETLVEDLLTMTRLDSGLMRSEPEHINLGVLLRDLARTYAPLAAAQQLTLTLELPDEPLPDIWVAPDQCMRVVLNLLSNAFKFTPAGGRVSLIVRLEEQHQHPGIAIAVADTGPGITAEECSRLFERFYRGNNPTAGGSGLGLAIVRELLALMGGTINVESVLGHGSTFTCWIPLARQAFLHS
jgi:signal transduction histidine kinase